MQLCVALRGAVLSYSCRLLTSFTEAEKIEKAKKKKIVLHKTTL